MYPAELVKPMREDLTNVGFEELHTPEAVKAALAKEGTTLVVVNSVCGCAAANARPGAKMSLNNPSTDCKDFNSPITWYVNKDGNFVLKIINNHKAKDVNTGYILDLRNVTETSFDLIDKVNVAGQVKDITYSFQRQ